MRAPIGGVILGGTGYTRVIFRGLGPSLSVNGVPVPGRLADPTLEVHDRNGATLAFNDDKGNTSGLALAEAYKLN